VTDRQYAVPAARAGEVASLVAILAATFGVGLIFGLQPPLIALTLQRGGASSLEIGAVTGIGSIAVIVFGPLYPRMIARIGLRGAVTSGIAFAAVILLTMPLLQGAWSWLTLRFLTGCVLGLSWIASEIWLNTISTDRRRGTVMGFYVTMFAAGVLSGPLLLQLTGTTGWRPFLIGAACLAFTALPLLFTQPPAGAGPSPPGRLLHLLRGASVVIIPALIAGLVESADVALLPVFGLRSGLDEPSSLLLLSVFLAGNVILQLPIGALADRIGRRRVLAGCASVGVIGPLLLPHFMGQPWLMVPLLLIWGGMMYGFYTQGIALLGETFAPAELADANTIFVVVYCAGALAGPTLGGLAMDLWPPYGFVMFLSAAAAVVIVGLLAPLFRRFLA
jgi:MFS family permease